ncbi:MAG: gliding motility-associated C-terminal domain-containing protein [Bacteroidota bacterium]
MKTIYILLVSTHLCFAQSFLCDNSVYLIGQEDGLSFLQVLNLDEEGDLVTTRDIPLSEPNRQYTCLGMSIEDMHLYALDFNTKELLRINAKGSVESLDVPENLDTNLEYWAGDVAPEGRRLIVVGKDKASGKDIRVYSISLVRDDHYAGSTDVVSNFPTEITDIATDPVRGTLYGYDKKQKQIVTIGTNVFSHYQHERVSEFVEGLFFDKNGNLYAYGGGETDQSSLYSIDKIDGRMTALGNVRKGRFGDACSCAYSMVFHRKIHPKTLVPCQEFTITYTILNKAGEGKTGSYFEDVLPEEFVITELVEHTFTLATVERGVGGNHFAIPNLDILIGENTMILKAKLNPTTNSRFETQANLQGLAIGLGGELFSDDLSTATPNDANINFLASNENVRLEDYLVFDCEEPQATLSLPIEADRYLWNDGSSEAILLVRDTGWYSIEAESECLLIKDSIHIKSFPELLEVNLMKDVQLQQGTRLPFHFETNAKGIQSLAWSSQSDFDLSCTDCEMPILKALKDNIYYLELTDDSNCTAKDSVEIVVEQIENLYIPNAFSPNEDGDNDRFFVQGIEGLAHIQTMQIFDRWGNLVYKIVDEPINDYTTAWNGRWKGRVLPTGTYIWNTVIEFIDGRTKILSGTVMLMPN